MEFLASIVASICMKLIEKLLGGLVDWSRDKAAQMADESKTADSLKETQDAKTEEERINAARDAARNAGN